METAQVKRDERPRRIEFRIQKNGETVWIEHACLQVVDASGGPLGIRASMRARVRVTNGESKVQSEPGRGTVIEVWVPVG